MDSWKGLKEEVVTATNIHKFKETLDIYGDMETGHYEPHSNPV